MALSGVCDSCCQSWLAAGTLPEAADQTPAQAAKLKHRLLSALTLLYCHGLMPSSCAKTEMCTGGGGGDLHHCLTASAYTALPYAVRHVKTD